MYVSCTTNSLRRERQYSQKMCDDTAVSHKKCHTPCLMVRVGLVGTNMGHEEDYLSNRTFPLKERERMGIHVFHSVYPSYRYHQIQCTY